MPGLWNIMRGYVIIEVDGRFPERFMNMCSKNNIVLWNVTRTSDRSFSAGLHLKDAKRLRRVARRTCCKVHFAKKKGLPFVLKRLVSHKLFIGGMIACMIMLTILNLFIWQVKITCSQPIDKREVMKILEQNGLKPGVMASKVDLDQCQVEIMKKCTYISWAYLKRNGMVVNVQLALAKVAPEVVSLDKPCNIVAERDGVIVSISVLKGEKAVAVGHLVRKGQIIVNGELKSLIETNPLDYVHAMGEVRATTWYEKSVVIGKTGAGEKSDIKAAVITGEKEILKKVPKDAIIKSTNVRLFFDENGRYIAKVTAMCLEDISMTVKIEGKECTR